MISPNRCTSMFALPSPPTRGTEAPCTQPSSSSSEAVGVTPAFRVASLRHLLTDQVIREDLAVRSSCVRGRGTETSAEVLVGPPWRKESNAGQQQWYGGYPCTPDGGPMGHSARSTVPPPHPPPQLASEGIGGARGLGNLVRPESHPEPRGFPVQLTYLLTYLLSPADASVPRLAGFPRSPDHLITCGVVVRRPFYPLPVKSQLFFGNWNPAARRCSPGRASPCRAVTRTP